MFPFSKTSTARKATPQPPSPEDLTALSSLALASAYSLRLSRPRPQDSQILEGSSANFLDTKIAML